MADEHQDQANVVLRRACRRLTRQQWYNQKITCIAHFHAEHGTRMTKAAIVRTAAAGLIDMTMEDYMSVSKLSIRFYVVANLQLHYLFFIMSFDFLGYAPLV